MKILFSPVGMTDPVSEERDSVTKELVAVHEGALLQICRHELPDKIYLYFSKEACELEQQDHRYLGGMELLGQTLGTQFDIQVIERPELTEVHLFDEFLQDFRDILTKIRDENPDAEILVNVSSGTPAMKSTLQILASASELNLKPLQVETWSYRPNHPRECNITQEWKINADLSPTAPKRVKESANTNLLYEFNRRILMKLIDTYDYHAAKTVALQLRGLIPPKFMELLDAAIFRSDAKFKDAQQKFRACGNENLMPSAVQTAEYFLLLDIYVKKEKYTDFLRALTPFIIEIFDGALYQMFGIDLQSLTRKKDSLMWDDYALKNSNLYGKFDQLPIYHQNDRKKHRPAPPFPSGYVLSWHLTNLIENLADPNKDRQFVTQTIELRNIEEAIRNLAAHTMQGFTVSDFRKEVRRSPQELILLLKNYVRNYTDIPLTDEFLQSYQVMNDKLKSYL